MKYFFAIGLFALILHFEAAGQFADDFSDGNLDGWLGNTENYIVNTSGQLQLNAPSGSTSSWIYTPVAFMDSMVWEVYFRLDFAPSTSNLLRIYLGLTSPDLTTASGYFLEIGATGDTDPLDFKYLDNGSATTIASSVPGLVALEPVDLTLRVVRNNQGLWQIFKLGGPLPELLFSTSHNIQPVSSLTTFGFYNKYTDTRRDKFRFDNITISPLQPDQTIPSWLTLTVADNKTVNLLFDEPLDPITSTDPTHYILTPGNTMPDNVVLNANEITLSWNQAFISNQDYTLTINNLKDLSGNVLLTDNKNFKFTQIAQAAPFDLLITEIMADPTPLIGLPDAEYLEIHNTSNEVFNLGDYKIRVGTTEKVLPDSLIHPGEFVILTDDANIASLSPFGRVIALSSMSALTNSGTSLALINSSGEVLHEVSYALSWYNDAVKSNGGWSLEMINPSHICSDQENWTAASNLLGGTPGQINSQWTTTPDIQGPSIVSLFTPSPDVVELRFDERIESVLMLNPALYVFQPSLNIDKVELLNAKAVRITLMQPLQQSVIYHLIPFSAIDCLGNPAAGQDTIVFGLVAPVAKGDILINELLFNPAVGGSRYIEIINSSQKFIDLSTLAIGRINATHHDIYPTGINEILAPGEIAVFTPDPSDILSRYVVPNPTKLYASTLPTWDDKEDQASLIAGGEFIDSLTFSSSWHHPVISDQNGVSLERISINAPTSSASSWHSASSVSGYGTPTGPNSQALQGGVAKAPFSITHKQFSPNNDGYKDFLLIDFSETSGDDIASVWIYDLEGRIVKQLLSNESIGTSALIQWDGSNADGRLADMGIYIVFVQLWNPAGDVTEYQQSCALVKR
ncbi:MAG: lamin tail domain-containing protein [Saprospiraceae bacterium]|uniref:Lamin tail domain-containing protein n=1 Tax=Candidatus Opimibacter skivensis TaxID=2982028 RepID=A0A9D7SWR3_9BACT|nr:lamin tail domain-containing protein [Candidatus Opimibacter skivensis]